jgi:hypothetical protein
MKYRTMHKWHIWLGWLVGVPLILWTASGLFMAARPIEEVRGEALRAEAMAITPITPAAPLLIGRPVEKLTLEQRKPGPVWLVQYRDGGMRRADALTGKLLPAVTAREAAELAAGYYRGSAKPVSVVRFAADKTPMDLRRERPSWQISYDDGARLYLDADSGALLAVRTRWWRWYDFMWGLHIMDLQTREDNSHPILILFALLSLSSLLLAFWMMFARKRKGRGRNAAGSSQA